MHEDYDIRQEQLNKASIMSSKSFLEQLLNMFRAHVVSFALIHETTYLFEDDYRHCSCKAQVRSSSPPCWIS